MKRLLAAVLLVGALGVAGCGNGPACPKHEVFTILYYRSQIIETNEGTAQRPVEVPVVQMVPVYGCESDR